MTAATKNQNALFKALKLDEPEEKFRFVLYMPHLTPILDPVVGEWCRTKYLAKTRVAMEAVRMLHRMGELDYHLKPKSRVAELEDEDDEAFATTDVVKDQKTESVSSEKSSSSCSEAAADPEKVEMAAKLAEMEEQVKTGVLNR